MDDKAAPLLRVEDLRVAIRGNERRIEIPSPERRRLQAYPHELSGGMRQRAMIG